MKKNYCYLCSKELVETKKLLLDEKQQALDHGEHIFQQAIGGTLIKKGILCSPCGNQLGSDIDAPFTSQFKNITSRIYFKQDRKDYNKKLSAQSENGLMEFQGEVIEVFAIGKDIYPVKPSYFKKDDKIYVLQREGINSKETKKLNKQLEQYINNLVKKEVDDFDNYEIVKVRNLKNKGPVTLELNINNIAFKKGFAKIATGFAISKGIPAKFLNRTLDHKNKKFRDQLVVAPYFPSTLLEKHIESMRFLTGNWENIFHSIKIKNFDKTLLAYIEIFGVYQVTVLLSDIYDGENIDFDYMQPLFTRKISLLEHMPDYESFQINYEHKLSQETLNRIKSEKWTDDLINQMNKDIHQYEIDYAKNLDIHEYYKNLIVHYSRLIAISKNPEFFTNGIPSAFASDKTIIKQLSETNSDEKFLSLIIANYFLENLLNYKFLTYEVTEKDFFNQKPNKLVLDKSIETMKYNPEKMKKYNTDKHQQLSVFIELYNHQLLREGCWQPYNSLV